MYILEETALIGVARLRVSRDRQTLTVTFDDGVTADLAAEMLRVMSPSAEVQGHGASDRKLVSGKRNVQISAVAPVGNYAVRLTFDDLHATGIFTWPYLRELADEREAKWGAYLAELAAKGVSR